MKSFFKNLFKRKQRRIPFSIEKFSQFALLYPFAFDVVTRNGFEARVLSLLPVVTAFLIGYKDCRGNDIYGYLKNGRRKEKGKDPLDLFLIKKPTS